MSASVLGSLTGFAAVAGVLALASAEGLPPEGVQAGRKSPNRAAVRKSLRIDFIL
jgi:hypothetical protein